MAYTILADMHVHTLRSPDAVSTLEECAGVAAAKRLHYIALTEHYMGYSDRLMSMTECTYYRNCNKLHSTHYSNIIGGVELNLNQTIEKQDAIQALNTPAFRLLGAHAWYIDRDTMPIDHLPALYMQAIRGPVAFQCFAHIERHIGKYYGITGPDSMKETLRNIVDIAEGYQIFLEINDKSVCKDQLTQDMLEYWLSYAKDKKVFFSLGSDAHCAADVGNLTGAVAFVNALGIPEDRIINCDEEYLHSLADWGVGSE